MIASIRETDLRYEGRAEGFAKGRAEGIVTGRAEGIVTGRGEEKSEIARRMLMHGDDEDYIHLITGLSSEEIRRLAWS
ncbi:MAG: hypothetical protein II877_02065 [Synergistaceae bacterium]|nr:hypothetical protein [Synergistaceae bacterium]